MSGQKKKGRPEAAGTETRDKAIGSGTLTLMLCSVGLLWVFIILGLIFSARSELIYRVLQDAALLLAMAGLFFAYQDPVLQRRKGTKFMPLLFAAGAAYMIARMFGKL